MYFVLACCIFTFQGGTKTFSSLQTLLDRHIPRIKSHCAEERTLDRCVQRLRKKMIVESYQARNREMLEQNGGDGINPNLNSRTPSFFQSPSLVVLGGLNICDPCEKVESMNEVKWDDSRVRSGSIPSNKGFPDSRESVDSNLGWGGMGLRGNHSYNNLTRSSSGGSGIFIGEDDEKDDEKDNQMANSSSWGRKMGTDADYVKTSNMADFYYHRKGHSHGDLREESKNDRTQRQGRPLSASMKVQSSEG